MQSFVDELAQQAAQHNMNVNSRKTNLLIGPIAKNPVCIAGLCIMQNGDD